MAFSPAQWLALTGLGIIGTSLPFALIYSAAGKLKPFISSVLLLTEPFWVYIFGALFLGQTLSFWALLGGLGIVVGILLV